MGNRCIPASASRMGLATQQHHCCFTHRKQLKRGSASLGLILEQPTASVLHQQQIFATNFSPEGEERFRSNAMRKTGTSRVLKKNSRRC